VILDAPFCSDLKAFVDRLGAVPVGEVVSLIHALESWSGRSLCWKLIKFQRQLRCETSDMADYPRVPTPRPRGHRLL